MTFSPAPVLHRAPPHWSRQLAFTVILIGLVTTATSTRWEFGAAGAAMSVLSLGFFWLIFPGGLHFGLTMANFLAVYCGLFAFFRDENFPSAGVGPTVAALVLPVFTFLLRCLIAHRRVAKMVYTRRQHELMHLPRLTRWLPAVAAVAVVSFALPQLALTPMQQDAALLAAMALISIVAALALRDLILLMMDVVLVIEVMSDRINRMVMPVMAFLSFYGLMVVLFACFYRIGELSLGNPQFIVHGQAARISFPDAVYFSVMTISTVGYGDIVPSGALVRTLAMLEVVCGLLMLLFGFAEIMRSGGPESELRREISAKSEQESE
jgi:voltage-gated potassium channel